MKISSIVFYTNDLEKISKFYREILGFEQNFSDNRFISFKIGETELGIKIKEVEREVPGHQTVIIATKDIEDLNKKLKEKGVLFYSELIDESWGKNFSILDLDKNKIEFVEEKN